MDETTITMPPSSDFTVNLILIISALIGYLFYVCKKKYEFWERLGVPSLGFSWDILLETKKNKVQAIRDRYNKMASHPYCGIYQATKPFLVIRDPELIKNILIKDFSHFTDRGMVFDEQLDPLNAHIFNLAGQRWRDIRTKLVPTFSSGKLKAMFPLMEECIKVLDGYLTDKLKISSECDCDVLELMVKFTTDVIGSCAFGFNCNAISDDESEFRRITRKLAPKFFKLRFRIFLQAIHPKITSWLSWKGFDREAEDFFMGVTRETIRLRDENHDKRNDFMQLISNLQHDERRMLDEQKDGTEPLFTDHVVAAQVFIFYFAGSDTTALTIANCLYELALNPDVMDKARAEILQVLDARGGKLDYDALKDMRYMESVISETLRKYPPVGWLDRICTKAYEFPDSPLLIKENTNIIIPVHSLHYDPKYFPEPDKFNPDRFNEEKKSKIIPGTYLPFGDGPRICIGMRFAMMEIQAALASIIQNYTVHPTSQTQVPWRMDKNSNIILRPLAGGIRLKFKKRVN